MISLGEGSSGGPTARWDLLRESARCGSTLVTGWKKLPAPLGLLGDRVSKSLALLVPAAMLVAEDLTVLPSRLWMETLKAGSNSGTR